MYACVYQRGSVAPLFSLVEAMNKPADLDILPRRCECVYIQLA